ncbi:MAG TPA: thiol reductant ABC exporter subunit CydC [Solirubrobacteraceae bacterium]|nr:thiol reductant ABC exporter subunit CydC [Solirubrobacteraceae bacterium]
MREMLAASRPVFGKLVAATLLGAGAMACAIGLAATSAWLISRSSQRPEESAVAVAIVAVQAFALGRGLLRYAERLVSHDAAFAVMARLRVRVYERVEPLAPAGLPAFRSGELLARLVGDVDSVQDLLLRVLPAFAIALIVGLLAVALQGAVLPAAGLVLLVALALGIAAVPWLTGRLAARTAAGQARARGELSAAVVELLAGAQELTVHGTIGVALERARAADRELAGAARSAARTAGVGQGLASALSGLAMWGSLGLGVAAVADGHIDGVLLAGLALVPLVAFELIGPLPAATQSLQGVRRSSERLAEVIGAPVPVEEAARPRARASGGGALAVRGLRCRYPGQDRWALAGVDLDLPPGSRVALIGPSGAGKTSLAWALVRFLPYRGSIALDGVEIDDLPSEEVRRVVGLVAQDAHIFDTSIEENLRLARREAGAGEVLDALERVRLLDWVRTLPEGIATEVGEHGRSISGGQRRRLALARALLARFPVLILDEPGEHLDLPTARALTSEFLDAAAGRTVLLVTHDLAGLEGMDEIVLLEGGRVAERGTHASLMERDRRYAELWRDQRSAGAGGA